MASAFGITAAIAD